MRSVGKNFLKSSEFSSGQPRVANGHKADENHVSKVSGSWWIFVDPHFSHFSTGLSLT